MTFLTEYFLVDLILFVAFLVGLVIVYFKWSYTYWEKRSVENLPPTIPFGNFKNVLTGKLAFGNACQKYYDSFKHLRYAGSYFLFLPMLIVNDLDLIRQMLTKDFQHFTDHGNYVNEENDPLAAHLFNLTGVKWKNVRAKLTPTFTSGKMKMMFQTLVDCSEELEVILKDVSRKDEPVDIKDISARFTTDVIGSCAFGIDCNSLKNPDSEFRKFGKRVFEAPPTFLIKNFVAQNFPNLADRLKIKFFEQDLEDFFMGVVKDTVAYREKNKVVRNDFMQLLLELKNTGKINESDSLAEDPNKVDMEDGTTLTLKEVAAHAFVFFLAGFETSSTTLTFCFYELVTNLEVQDKLREEIVHVLEKHGGKITYDAIMEMHYMDMCINETLRKYPPIPILTRECTQTYQVPDSDLVIKKGMRLFIPTLGIHHNSKYYPDPEKFDPERFSDVNKSKRHPFAWLPFGEGPRTCIGLRFGMMQAKVALTALLRNFKFTLNTKTHTPLQMDPKSFIMNVKGGVWLNVDKI